MSPLRRRIGPPVASRRAPGVAAAALLSLIVGPVLAGGPPGAGAQWLEDGTFELRSDRVDGVHRDLPVDPAPIRQAGITIALASPSNELEILSHALALRPLAGAATDATLRLELRGRARLVARIDVVGLPGELEDQVTVPLQAVTVAAQVRLDRLPEGYRLEVVEAPESVSVAIESRLGEQLVALCRALTLFAGGGQACSGLGLVLSTLRIPLPEPGEAWLITPELLTERERSQLDAYLARS